MSKEEFSELLRNTVSSAMKTPGLSLNEDRLYSIVDASRYLNLSPEVISILLKSGKLKGMAYQGKVLFTIHELNVYKTLKEVENGKSL